MSAHFVLILGDRPLGNSPDLRHLIRRAVDIPWRAEQGAEGV